MVSRRLLLTGGAAALLPRRAQAREALANLLQPLMTEHHVPGASAALIRNGGIADHTAVGVRPETLFQAASISKVVAGQVILLLADHGEIDLDRPVNDMLRSWKLPGHQAQAVTPRLLLSHRAGTNVPGFPGYIRGTPLPDLREILGGSPPANTPPVQVEQEPGRAFLYSGGGTMVLQQLALDVAGRGFEDLAADLIVAPAGMARSSFKQPLPSTERNVAAAHDLDGQPLPDGSHVYPELAAAGLWSTAIDLAHLALAISESWRDLLYHYGVNAGFRSVLTFVADGSFGLALMTNGEGGRPLIPAFCGAVFAANGQGLLPPID